MTAHIGLSAVRGAVGVLAGWLAGLLACLLACRADRLAFAALSCPRVTASSSRFSLVLQDMGTQLDQSAQQIKTVSEKVDRSTEKQTKVMGKLGKIVGKKK